MADIITGVAIEGESVVLMARITGHDRLPIVQATLTKIEYQLWRVYPDPEPPEFTAPTSPSAASGIIEPPIADSIFDALKTDARWTVDVKGYNFLTTIAAGVIPLTPINQYPPERYYEIPVRFTPLIGARYGAVYRIKTNRFLIGKVL